MIELTAGGQAFLLTTGILLVALWGALGYGLWRTA